MSKYLSEIKKIKTIDKLVEFIIEIFREFDNEQYMPALIEEGSFSVEDGEDFYLKLILKHSTVKFDKTWMKSNLSFGLCEPGDEDYDVHNVLVYRKYKSSNLYQVNPLIVDEAVSEYEYNNTDYINAYYNDEYDYSKGKALLKNGENIKLLIIKDIFQNYINDINGNIYPKYQLVAEFEYRTHQKHLAKLNEEPYKYKNAFIKVDVNRDSTYVLGSVEIPYVYKKDSDITRNIRVLNLDDLTERSHNPRNYDGDINEGLIYFKKDIIRIISRLYYIYDLQIYDKSNIKNVYMIDILDDKIMFFEGEYNRLPKNLKESIDQYNFIPSKGSNNLISPAMYEWQLQSNWNWNEKLLPNFKLASEIKSRMFESAIDIAISFEVPENREKLGEFIVKIEKLTGIKLEAYNVNSTDVKSLIKIRDRVEDIKIDSFEDLYQKYCYAIIRGFNDVEY